MKGKREFYTVTFQKCVFVVDKRYQNLKPIGHGSYGYVCSADDVISGRKVAIKKTTDLYRDLVDSKRILREVKLIRHLGQHPNIAGLVDLFAYPYNTKHFTDLYLVLVFFESDLDRIISSPQQLGDSHFQFFMYQLLKAMKFFHSAKILHRDLKPPNILVNANCDLAVCDFGLARALDGYEGSGIGLTSYVVTRWYRAPELLLECETYGPAMDMWSCGCILAEMLRRKPFLKGREYMHQLKLIVRVLGKPSTKQLSFVTNPLAYEAISKIEPDTPYTLEDYFPHSNPLALDLLKRMLQFNPNDRISDDEALRHPYLAPLFEEEEILECEEFRNDFEKGYGEEIPKNVQQDILWVDLEYYDELLNSKRK